MSYEITFSLFSMVNIIFSIGYIYSGYLGSLEIGTWGKWPDGWLLNHLQLAVFTVPALASCLGSETHSY